MTLCVCMCLAVCLCVCVGVEVKGTNTNFNVQRGTKLVAGFNFLQEYFIIAANIFGKNNCLTHVCLELEVEKILIFAYFRALRGSTPHIKGLYVCIDYH